jgi:hypothetical protein
MRASVGALVLEVVELLDDFWPGFTDVELQMFEGGPFVLLVPERATDAAPAVEKVVLQPHVGGEKIARALGSLDVLCGHEKTLGNLGEKNRKSARKIRSVESRNRPENWPEKASPSHRKTAGETTLKTRLFCCEKVASELPFEGV